MVLCYHKPAVRGKERLCLAAITDQGFGLGEDFGLRVIPP